MKYAVQSLIGKGSTSKVFLVREMVSGELYVMKEREGIKGAKREAKLLQSARSHPFVVTLKDVFVVHSSQRVCIVMERAERDLRSVLQTHARENRTIEHSQAVSWACQVALGLAFLHSRRIAHRDIKPANLLLLPDGRLVLGDLGAGKRNVDEQCGTRSLLGTPFYLAPEILQCRIYGTRSDAWAFGCVLFEIASSGQSRPFPARSLEQLRKMVLGREIAWHMVSTDHPLFDSIPGLLQLDPLKRMGITDVLRAPVFVRALGGFVTDLVEHKFSLTRDHAQCLFEQVSSDLMLKSTLLAAIHLGLDRLHRARLATDSQVEVSTTSLSSS